MLLGLQNCASSTVRSFFPQCTTTEALVMGSVPGLAAPVQSHYWIRMCYGYFAIANLNSPGVLSFTLKTKKNQHNSLLFSPSKDWKSSFNDRNWKQENGIPLESLKCFLLHGQARLRSTTAATLIKEMRRRWLVGKFVPGCQAKLLICLI